MGLLQPQPQSVQAVKTGSVEQKKVESSSGTDLSSMSSPDSLSGSIEHGDMDDSDTLCFVLSPTRRGQQD